MQLKSLKHCFEKAKMIQFTISFKQNSTRMLAVSWKLKMNHMKMVFCMDSFRAFALAISTNSYLFKSFKRNYTRMKIENVPEST